jgi:hypothetical protein
VKSFSQQWATATLVGQWSPFLSNRRGHGADKARIVSVRQTGFALSVGDLSALGLAGSAQTADFSGGPRHPSLLVPVSRAWGLAEIRCPRCVSAPLLAIGVLAQKDGAGP